MRVNIYAEELTDRIEIVNKINSEGTFTGLRIYLELPVTYQQKHDVNAESLQVQGPFRHQPGDDCSSAITFWGKRDLIEILQKALKLLQEHYYEPLSLEQDLCGTVQHIEDDKAGYDAVCFMPKGHTGHHVDYNKHKQYKIGWRQETEQQADFANPCGVKHPLKTGPYSYYTCTLTKGHTGCHAAHSYPLTPPIAVWEQVS